jgi:hypothetical protein
VAAFAHPTENGAPSAQERRAVRAPHTLQGGNMATIDIRGASLSAADPPVGTNPNPDLAIKAPARAATTGANITLAGLFTLDGVALAAGDRVLVKDQADPTANGLYNAATGPWTRTIDAANNSQWAQGMQVLVAQGTANAATNWECTTTSPITLGTSLITWAQSFVQSARKINTTAPLAGGGALSTDLTLSLTIGGTLAVVGNALQTIAGTGDVTWSANSFATTIAANAVTNAKAAQMGANTIKGNNTGSTANASDLSVAQVQAMLGGWNNIRIAKTGNYSVATADSGSTFALGGSAFFSLTFPTASTVSPTQVNAVINEDTVRAKNIIITGGTNFILYPGQTVIVYNDNNVWKVLGQARWRIPGATYLATTVTFFVDNVNGSDSNDGLASGAGGAFLTLTHARDVISNQIDFNGQQVVIQAAASQTWTETFDLRNGWVGGGQWIIDGGGSTFGSSTSHTFNLEMSGPGFFEVQNMTIINSASGASCFNANGPGVWNIGAGVTFGATQQAHILASGSGSVVSVNNNYTVSGGGACHFEATQGGFLVFQSGLTVTVSANITFSIAFAFVTQGANAQSLSNTFTLGGHTVTGNRYNVQQNGVMFVNGGGANYFPGSVAGTTATGGQYN